MLFKRFCGIAALSSMLAVTGCFGGGKKNNEDKKVNTEEVANDSEKPAEETAEKPAEETAEKPAEETAEKPAEETAEKPVEETAEKPAEETAEKPAEEPVVVVEEEAVTENFVSNVKAQENVTLKAAYNDLVSAARAFKTRGKLSKKLSKTTLYVWGKVDGKLVNSLRAVKVLNNHNKVVTDQASVALKPALKAAKHKLKSFAVLYREVVRVGGQVSFYAQGRGVYRFVVRVPANENNVELLNALNV